MWVQNPPFSKISNPKLHMSNQILFNNVGYIMCSLVLLKGISFGIEVRDTCLAANNLKHFYQFNQATTLFFWDILFQIFSKYWSDTLFKNQFIQVLCWGQWILQIKCILESPHSQDIYIISLNTFKYLIDWYQFYFWKIQRLSQWAKSPHTLVDQTTWSSSLFHSSFIIESH